jgi:hypothetical protein
MDIAEEFKMNFSYVNPLTKYHTRNYIIENDINPWAYNCFKIENGYDMFTYGITFKTKTSCNIKNNLLMSAIGTNDKRTLVLLPTFKVEIEKEYSIYYCFGKVKIEYCPNILYYYFEVFNNFDLIERLKEDLEVKIHIKLEKEYSQYYSDKYSDIIIKTQIQ